jgi:SAM-dependent methyltransferase
MDLSLNIPVQPMFVGTPPHWALHRPKGCLQSGYDLCCAPLRMIFLPDHQTERLHLTSLRAERLAAVLPEIRGRLLDIGAGDNMLVSLYRDNALDMPLESNALQSIGVDVFDWGGGCTIVPDCRRLPFSDGSFDTVTFVACLNHIPERQEALKEAYRLLRPGGRIIITMIGSLIGTIGHALWWHSEDKHRSAQEGEMMGIDPQDIENIVKSSGFADLSRRGFVYGLNHLFIAYRY